MKKPLFYSFLLLFCVAFWQCAEDDAQSATPDKVSVTFSIGSPVDVAGRVAAGTRPTTLYISLATEFDAPVFTQKPIKLIAMGDTYISEPLDLAPAVYKVTSFILTDDEQNTLYAAPKKGAPLEKIVSRPLPFRFQVVKNEIQTIGMQVVDVAHYTPADFGYASFSFEVVNPLRMSVFTQKHDQLQLSSATAYILHGVDTVKKLVLDPAVNLVGFIGDPMAHYTLVVEKEGYNPYKLDFTYKALADSLADLPLKVTLGIPFTMITYRNVGSYFFQLEGIDSLGTYYVSWGDGTTDVFTVDIVNARHDYATGGNYRISVTGDLDKVIGFHGFYDEVALDSIDFSGLQNVVDISLGWMQHGPALVDLRYNPKLEVAQLSNIQDLREVRLPVNNIIRYIDLGGRNQLDADDVNDVIEKVYNAAVQRNTRNGGLNVSAGYTPGPPLTGPPSAQSLAKLQTLADDYNWWVPGFTEGWDRNSRP